MVEVPGVIPDETTSVTFEIEDFDGDKDQATALLGIDGNGDGTVDFSIA